MIRLKEKDKINEMRTKINIHLLKSCVSAGEWTMQYYCGEQGSSYNHVISGACRC